MPLHVHHAHRAELLVDGLAEVLATPPSDAFAPEVVAVPARGIERWIAQRLSHVLGTGGEGRDDGIAANVEFPFPGAIIADAAAAATGVDPALDPWRSERLVWPLLDVVTEVVAAGEHRRLGPLAVHVRPDGAGSDVASTGGLTTGPDGAPSDQRLASVHRVAELFDRYAIHRPAMLRAWADGRDADPTGRVDLPERTRWQPWLWRQVRERLDEPSGPERLTDATAALASGRTATGAPVQLALPDRLTIFGLTALSATTLEVLAALATGPGPSGQPRDVHLFLRHASPALWRHVAEVLDQAGGMGRIAATATTSLPTRDQDPTAGVARDPLLAAWARDSRELQVVAATVDATWHDRTGVPVADAPSGSEPVPPAPADLTLLGRLQEAIAVDRPRRVDDALPALAPDDRSVQLHRCHGPARQVEVLRDLVLHLLADHPDLEPRDILVQCPDIETYAPLIEAVFARPAAPIRDGDGRPAEGSRDDGAAAGLRVQLADRALTRTNPLLRVLAEVLTIADGRLTASQILDLCTREPVRRRFDLDEDDLGTLDAWLTSTGIRWGLDGAHRARHEVPTEVNTWRAGLDRLLAGVAAADEQLRTVVGIAPEDDVEGDHVELAGRFAELLSRLEAIVATLRSPRPIGAWLDLLRRDVIGQLCGADPEAAWQEAGVDRALEQLRDAVRGTGADAGHLPLTLAEIRDLLHDRLAGAPSKAAHRTGELTVCTLVPMRSVPHEVVIWLGMDDEVFPRRTVPDGDDLLAADPVVGDRDPRSEDRQLLLDALLAARRRLIVLTTGADERTGEARPAAVPIGELLDAIDRTVALPGRDDHRPDGDPAHAAAATGGTDDDPRPVPRSPSQAITTDHPLQGFDARRFTPGALGPVGHPPVPGDLPFGFDRDDLDAAAAMRGERHEPRPFIDGRLAPHDEGDRIALGDLTAFLIHPIQALLTQRLDVRYPRDGDLRDDAIPVEVGYLAKHAIGDRLLQERIAGHDPRRWLEVERSRGTLPPGDLADDIVEDCTTTVDMLLATAQERDVPLGSEVTAHPIDVPLPDGRRLTGSVGVVGETRRSVRYARVGPKHRLAAWVDLLALIATDPQRPWQALTLGRGRSGVKGADASVSLLAPGRTVTRRNGRKQVEVVGILGDGDATAEERQQRAIEELTALIALRDRGLCGPLLLPCGTAAGWAEKRYLAELRISRADPVVAARNAWVTDQSRPFPAEDVDHAHVTVLGHLDLEDLLTIPPEPDEDGPGWTDEPSRFGRLARRLWDPLLSCEDLRDLEADR